MSSVKFRAAFTVVLNILCGMNMAQGQFDFDALEMPLEELTRVRIISTPKFSENPDAIPSAVSIITRRDIRTFGWRNIGEVLRSLSGFNVTNDHAYSYAGVRGVSPVGDFRARMQVLIDGISVNENIYSAVPVDSAFPLDISLVERIEVLRGPSASTYGGDSMFGVINIVTRSGSDMRHGEAELSIGSGREMQLRTSWAGEVSGSELLLSATGFRARGSSENFGDVQNGTVPVGINGLGAEEGGKLFLRGRGTDWRLTLIHSKRDRYVPTGSYATIVNDRDHVEADGYSLIDFNKEWQLAPKASLNQRFYAGNYTYDGRFPYDNAPDDPRLINIDKARGSWWGMDTRYVNSQYDRQRWTLGFEYRANYRQNQINYDLGYGCFGVGTAACLDDERRSEQITLFAQDEIQLSPADTLIGGIRYDRRGSFWSPRLGHIHSTDKLGIFKLLYGTAFRLPSPYEIAYITPTYTYGNPDASPEKMKSLEFTWELPLSPQAQLLSNLYHYRIRNMISTDGNGTVLNTPDVLVNGLELAYRQHWQNGSQIAFSYTGLAAREANGRLDNSPRHMLKFNLAYPSAIEALSTGLEIQWVDSRRSNMGQQVVGGHLLANLNLRYAPGHKRWETGLGIYNLFDRHYLDPVSPDLLANNQVRSSMPQLGRSIQLRTLLRF